MAQNIPQIAESIQKEAQDKYSSKNLLDYLEGYNTDIYEEIVAFFKTQDERHPHLEAYEIYLLVEENLPNEKPGKEEIRKTIDRLLNIEGTE